MHISTRSHTKEFMVQFFRRFSHAFLLSLSLSGMASAQDATLPVNGFYGFLNSQQLKTTYAAQRESETMMRASLGLGYDVNQYVAFEIAHALNSQRNVSGTVESMESSIQAYYYGVIGKLPLSESFKLLASLQPTKFSSCTNTYKSQTGVITSSSCDSTSATFVTVGAEVALDRRSSLRVGYTKSSTYTLNGVEQSTSGPGLQINIRF